MRVFQSNTSYPLIVLLIGVVLLGVFFVLSLSIGSRFIAPNTSIQAVLHPDPLNIEHILVSTTRLSRSVLAIIVGACLTVSGLLMQALTRNALASPSIFGINSGATFSIVLFSLFFQADGISHQIWWALLGSFVSGTMVYLIGSLRGGQLNTLRVVLAGAAISALFSSFTQAILVIDQESLDSILFWLAGSVANRSITTIAELIPFIGVAILGAFVIAIPINVLMTGENIAKGLGQRTKLIQLIMGLIIIVLAGCAVSMAGSIAFVGLIVPHIVRRLMSTSVAHQWLIPGCMVYGAVLLLIADIIARVIIFPQEIPIGVMTALIGTPLFIYLIRKGMRHD